MRQRVRATYTSVAARSSPNAPERIPGRRGGARVLRADGTTASGTLRMGSMGLLACPDPTQTDPLQTRRLRPSGSGFEDVD